MNKLTHNILFIINVLLCPHFLAQNESLLEKDSLLRLNIIQSDSLKQTLPQNKNLPNNTIFTLDTSVKIIENQLYNGQVVQMLIIGGDTSYLFNLQDFKVIELIPYGDIEKDKQLRRLKYHVTKVYPYAKVAADKLKMYNEELLKVKSNRQRRKLLKQREQELKEEFTEVIKKMTVTQGRILTKLIDRETGESTYEIIKEMRGGFKAFIYQGVAKIYDGDLKTRYNPKNNLEDEMIERIVQSIEANH